MPIHQNDDVPPPDDPDDAVSKRPPIIDLPTIKLSLPETKRLRILPPYDQERKSQPLDESRRLFQRLWTDEDEIGLLQGFLEFSLNRGAGGSHVDTAVFYDQIRSKLQLDFNKNQLVEKLRRLKKKYRTAIGKISSGKEFLFKTPHDQATFEISKKIWSNTLIQDEEDGDERSIPFSIPSKKRYLPPPQPAFKIEDYSNGVGSSGGVNGLSEDALRGCASQLREFVNGERMGGVVELAMGAMPLGNVGECSDERWRKQQILELEVYAKRLELIQDLIREQVEELRSIDRGG